MWLLSVSLLLNLLCLAAVVQVIRGRGGMAYLKSIVLKDNEATVDPGSRARRDMYASMPAPRTRPIVFLGDSITVACEWHETVESSSPILNRAIGGDTSLGVFERVAEVCRLNPLAVFLMIGTNDAQMLRYAPLETHANIAAIVKAILAASPDCLIYLESVLPSRVPKFNAWSEELNRLNETVCDGQQVTYLDLRPQFLDEAKALNLKYTHDGLHLNAEGYSVWRRAVNPILEQLASAKLASATA